MYDTLTPSQVTLGHALGLDVYVWGANGRARMAEALFYGVDGIHHSDPEYALNFLSEDDCSDNADNDQDGFVDFPDDPGCASPTDDSERSTVVCDDGIDNDSDGLVDFSYDPDCASPLGNTEQVQLVPLLSPLGVASFIFFIVAASLPSVRHLAGMA